MGWKVLGLVSLLVFFCGGQAFAGSQGTPLTPEEGMIGNGLQNCVENPQSCTNMGRLDQAWRDGMSGAQVATKNWLQMIQGLLKQGVMPTPIYPGSIPGVPPPYPVYTMPYPPPTK